MKLFKTFYCLILNIILVLVNCSQIIKKADFKMKPAALFNNLFDLGDCNSVFALAVNSQTE